MKAKSSRERERDRTRGESQEKYTFGQCWYSIEFHFGLALPFEWKLLNWRKETLIKKSKESMKIWRKICLDVNGRECGKNSHSWDSQKCRNNLSTRTKKERKKPIVLTDCTEIWTFERRQRIRLIHLWIYIYCSSDLCAAAFIWILVTWFEP